MKITERDGVTWINDAYNASPGSMRAVIEWVSEFAEPEKAVAVLGDMLELGEYSADAHFEVLEHALNRLPEAILITVGMEMEKAANKFGRSDNIISCRNSLEAGERINAFLAPGKIVLLKGSRGMKLELIEPGS
jgi:UDP-N-acetylmuramoyl-tripeptide--D-alanyl-D-alanine ligase